MSPLAGALELAVRAALAAGDEIRARFGGVQAVRFKDPDQPVTDADLAADAVLRRVLSASRHGWLSEESAGQAGEGGFAWVVDPIDGTSSFVAGVPEFAVSIGLLRGDEPVLGVIHNPMSRATYTAVEAGGAFLDGARIRVRAPARRVLMVSRFERARGAFDSLAGWTMEECGSTALKMCRVAEGAADGFVSFGPKHLWDVCGAAVILREAGGLAVDLSGRPIVPAPGSPPAGAGPWRGMVAASPARMEELARLAALAPAARAG